MDGSQCPRQLTAPLHAREQTLEGSGIQTLFSIEAKYSTLFLLFKRVKLSVFPFPSLSPLAGA